jgi:hypothetical protein
MLGGVAVVTVGVVAVTAAGAGIGYLAHDQIQKRRKAS